STSLNATLDINLSLRRKPANQTSHHTLDLNSFRSLDKDRLELRVGRFETNKLRLAVKLFHRCIVAIDKRNYHLSVLCSFLRRDDDDVAILDVFVDHRFAAYAQGKCTSVPLHVFGYGDSVVAENCLNRLARSHGSQ